MSKELTEKLENGKLERGYYYAKGCCYSDDDISYFDEIIEADGSLVSYSGDEVYEVLSPVPSYEELQKLKEQLKDANKVIKKYSDGTIYLFPTWYNGSRLAEAYLEKWGVK